MKCFKYDTLSFQLGVRPGTTGINFGSAQVPKVALAVDNFVSNGNFPGLPPNTKPKSHPEVDALVFYALNHAVSLIKAKVHPLEPLGEYLPLVELYQHSLATLSVRMFSYLLLICTRESRHAKMPKGFTSKYGSNFSAAIAFHSTLSGLGSSGSVSKFKEKPPACDLGTYTKYIRDVFYECTFSAGFGGPAWGAIADVLHGFVVGEMSAELMMDTAFTLCHNNGPIFNKGMLFECYSGSIYTILDVQRSGQIPQLIAEGGVHLTSDPQVASVWNTCFSSFPMEFGGYVDWFKVEELGSVGKYPDKKAAQAKKYGHPSLTPASNKIAKEANETGNVAKCSLPGQVEIMPGLMVKLVEVQR